MAILKYHSLAGQLQKEVYSSFFERALALILHNPLINCPKHAVSLRIQHFNPNRIAEFHKQSLWFASINGFNHAHFRNAGITHPTLSSGRAVFSILLIRHST